MGDDIRADKSNTIPRNDYESDSYALRKKCLVTFITQPLPMGANDNGKRTKMIEDEGSKLDGEEVDVDIFELYKFINSLPDMKPDFKLMRNHTLNEIDEKLQKLETKGNRYGSFIFVILTYVHTERDEIQVENRGVMVDHFFDTIKSFESMAAKPKLFLIQADDLRMLKPTTTTKAEAFDHKENTEKIPTDADRIVLMSTIPQELSNRGQVAHRTEHGQLIRQTSDASKNPKMSLLVQAFIDVLTENPDTDFLCNTPLIVGRVDALAEDLKKRLGADYIGYDIPVPVVTSTLTKRLFLGRKIV
ncbi:uncharacterized protein LOC128245098 [Mya arenaria]|uniref:uncharacterized protein LOC128245098 n=1 Tax=Mya arenaria TaxID=6604 RepID=UPI0022E78531|nr:uncharacterized protein LOC128245098 [Mya arenaria]XP_052819277.1 uncharacterized protein LOC128245098 [Mya arenaria]